MENPYKNLQSALSEHPDVKAVLGHAALARMTAVKKLRKNLVSEGFDVTELDAEITLLKGTKEVVGLFDVLGVTDEPKKEKPAAPDIGEQRDLTEERDYRTHSLNTDGVRELVSKITSDEEPAAAVRILNALEDGERDREPKPRKTVMDVIRDARTPLVAKVKKLEIV